MTTGYKQVIVVRKDLNMRKGKMVAQGAHASLAAVLSCAQSKDLNKDFVVLPLTNSIPLKDNQPYRTPLGEWILGNFKKVCVSVNSEQELLDIYNKATKAGLTASLIQDSGLTEFDGVPTYTSVAVGPDSDEKVNEITGNLPLL